MKVKIFLVTIFAFLATLAAAQNLFRSLGKAIGNKVKSEVVNKVKSSNNRVSKVEQDMQQQKAQGEQQETLTSNHSIHAIVSNDVGQNIVQQGGLDYIDEYGINHGGGVLIGGVLWAPVNCGYHATDYPYGKLYQWGRKHGQGYGEPYKSAVSQVRPDAETAEIVPAPVTPSEARKHPNRFYAHSTMSGFNWTANDMMLWNQFTDDGIISKNKANDPCPEGWRMPDMADFSLLAKHYSELTTYYDGGQRGRWFSGPEPYSTEVQRIFLPMSGYRDPDGISCQRDSEGAYWSGRHGGGEGLVWHLYFHKSKVEVYPMAYPHEAYSVRCVKDISGQRL